MIHNVKFQIGILCQFETSHTFMGNINNKLIRLKLTTREFYGA